LYSQGHHKVEADHCRGSARYAVTAAETGNEFDIQITGKLTKNLGHLSVGFSQRGKNTIIIDLHHGARKNVATLRTVKTLINNLIIGVTKGFLYKMRYVYAHFPINVNIEKNADTGLFEVAIRYVGKWTPVRRALEGDCD